MRTELWGRPRWVWLVDLAIVVVGVGVVLIIDRPASPTIAGGFVFTRVVVWIVQVATWFQKRGELSDAPDDRVGPPR